MYSENNKCDEEFVPFLESLGVDTYKKSFEWMLNGEYCSLWQWITNNLDQNNVYSKLVECRYNELLKQERLLTQEELTAEIERIKEEFSDICIPGEYGVIEDVKLDISFKNELLDTLNIQETEIKRMVNKNLDSEETVMKEIQALNDALTWCEDDEKIAAEECLKLAEEVEDDTDTLVDIISASLSEYADCNADKSIAKKFITYGPFDAYTQSQTLFWSHVDLFVARRLTSRQREPAAGACARAALAEAARLEEAIKETLCAYIESEAEYRATLAKMEIVQDATNLHHQQAVSGSFAESQLSLELLSQEEGILEQQLRNAGAEFAALGTALVAETAARGALAIREEMWGDLCTLADACARALSLAAALYAALRHELRAAEQLLRFAADLRDHVRAVDEAVADRIESMKEICTEQELCAAKLQPDRAVQALCAVLGSSPGGDAATVTRLLAKLYSDIAELKDTLLDTTREKEKAIVEYERSTRELRSYVYDGSGRRARGVHAGVAALAHALRHRLAAVDAQVLEASGTFAAVKNGDKQGLRKLWQWFLADPPRLRAAIKTNPANRQE